MARRRRRASKVSGTKSSGKSKKGFPSWVKPTVSMLIGGGAGMLALGLLPDPIRWYAPAIGVLGSKFIGGGSWGKYAGAAAVVGGLTFLGRTKTLQVATGSLAAAKQALTGGPSTPTTPNETGDAPSENARARGDRILREVMG